MLRNTAKTIVILFSRIRPVHTVRGTIWTIWGAITLMCNPGRLNRQICQQYSTYGISWVEWFVNVNSSPDVGSVVCCLGGSVTAHSTSVIQQTYSLYATSMCVGDQQPGCFYQILMIVKSIIMVVWCLAFPFKNKRWNQLLIDDAY